VTEDLVMDSVSTIAEVLRRNVLDVFDE